MFKNKKFEVKMVKDEETPAEPSKPIDVDKTVDTVMTAAMATIIVYFGCDLIRGVVTHVVVTKVK
jgi:hypothetical protein